MTQEALSALIPETGTTLVGKYKVLRQLGTGGTGVVVSAMRLDLTGGVNRLAEAVAAGAREADPHRIAALADAFGPKGAAAQRRLASLTRTLELPLDLSATVNKRQPMIRMDPRDEHVAWFDPELRVAWNETPDELRAVTRY